MTIQATMPVIQAHRGYSERYPENTMLAFRQAIANGADGIECDLWISADDEFVICHDDTLDRTTNDVGAISGLTWNDISTLDASYPHKFGDKFTGKADCKVPRLDDVLGDFQTKPNHHIVIQIKTATKAQLEEMVDKVISYNMLDRVYFFANVSLINYMKEYNQSSLTYNDGMPTIDSYQAVLDNAIQNNHLAVSVDLLNSSREDLMAMINHIKKSGIKIHGSYLAGNYEARTKMLQDLGIDFILTDDPLEVRRVLEGFFRKANVRTFK